MHICDSMPTRMISVVVVALDSGDEGEEVGGGICCVSEGSHMLNKVLSTWALHKGWDKNGVSSETVGPRRVAFWVVKRYGMERAWAARRIFWVVRTLQVKKVSLSVRLIASEEGVDTRERRANAHFVKLMDRTAEFLLEVADAADMMILARFHRTGAECTHEAVHIACTDNITGLSMAHALAAIVRERHLEERSFYNEQRTKAALVACSGSWGRHVDGRVVVYDGPDEG